MAYQPTFTRFAVGAVSAAMVGFSLTTPASAESFSDISDSTHLEAILNLTAQGIIKGYPDGTFKPYQPITRGDAAVMIARVHGLLNRQNIPSSAFKDLHTVNPTTQEAIAKLSALGIISGYSNESYKPLETVTRGQMAKMIVKAFNLQIIDGNHTFPDVYSQAVLASYVATIANAGITIGKADGTFGYGDQQNRGDFAAMITRAQKFVSSIIESPITIEGDEQGNGLVNGSAKAYTVTLINPVSKKPIEGARLNVTFAENIGTDFGPRRNVEVTNGYGDSTIPYQANDGHEAEIHVVTDKNGKATFTITGTNATVTPIVFLDGSNQEWDTKGGPVIITQDGRFDEEFEFHAKADPVTFGITPYDITVEGQRTNYAAIATKDAEGKITEHNGREYKITVKKPDGTRYGGGTVNVGIEEWLDRKLGNEPTGAYFTNFRNGAGEYLTQGQIKLNAQGEATVVLASTAINDSAKPIVWIDQNFANNFQPGTLEDGEPMSDQTKVDPTNFQNVRVDNGILGAKLAVTQENMVGEKNFTLTFLNQSGKVFNPGKEVKAHVTFQVINSGTHPVEINTSLFKNLALTNVQDTVKKAEKVVIEVGGRVTISGETATSTVTLSALALEGVSSVQVQGSAVLSHDVGYESNSVYVYTDYLLVNLPYSYTATILSTVTKDTNGNGANDQIVLTFDKEVYHFEPGDFRITHSGGNYSANTVTKEDKKLILTFREDAFNHGETTLHYDPNYSGTEVLSDEFGNIVNPFHILFNDKEIVKEVNNEKKEVSEVIEGNAEVIEKVGEEKEIITDMDIKNKPNLK